VGLAKLLTFYITYLGATTFLKAVVPPYVFSHGIGFQVMIIGLLVAFGTQILIFLLSHGRSLTAKISWVIAILATFLSVVFIVNIHSSSAYYLSAFFNGINLFFFWVFYNIAHFENTPKGKTGISSGIMFGVSSLIGVVVPIASGFLAEVNIWIVWAVATLALLFTVFLIKFQNNFTMYFDIKKSFQEIKATRVLIILSGVWDSLVMGLIPIYTLFFIKTPLGYASFLSYLSIVSVVATLIIGRWSDRLNKRVIFLYPITLILSVTTFAFTLVNGNIIFWAILSGVIAFLLPTFWNLSTAIIVDNTSDLRLAFPGRELALAVGRVIGFLVIFVDFYLFKKPFFSFIVMGSAILLYSVVLFWEGKVRKIHTYL